MADELQSEPAGAEGEDDLERALARLKSVEGASVDVALAYARLGIPVFPCCPNTKKPHVRKGFYAATTDPKDIRKWWRCWPRAMVGVPTGERFGVVIDIDLGPVRPPDQQISTMRTAMLEQLRASLGGNLPACLIAYTPKGGMHLLFAMPSGVEIGNRFNIFGARKGEPAIDVRGTGGYVIVAGSQRRGPKAVEEGCDGQFYEWDADEGPGEDFALPSMPPAVIELITKRETTPAGQPEPGRSDRRLNVALGDRRQAHALKAFNAEIARLEALTDGRNVELNKTAMKLGQLVAAGTLARSMVEAALEAASHTNGEVKAKGIDSVRRTIASGLSKGLSEPRDLSHIGEQAFPSAGRSPRLPEPPEPVAPHSGPAAAGGNVVSFADATRQTKQADERRAAGADSDEGKVKRLASLSALEYEKARTAAAEEMGLRASILDKLVGAERKKAAETSDGGSMVCQAPEPWPDGVDGAQLLRELVACLKRFLILPTHSPEVMALWILYSHAYDAFQHSPILAIQSAVRECGKSTTMDILSELVPKPLPAANLTVAATFRAIEEYSPALLVDEAETFLSENPELRGVLNSGHSRKFATVLRVVGDDHKLKAFRVWCPKVIAQIGKLHNTLQSRSIVVTLKRKLASERVENFRGDRTGALTELARKAARWAGDNLDALRAADPLMPGALPNRQGDNWRPLLAVADRAAGEWPAIARKAAEAIEGVKTGQEEEGSTGLRLLRDMHAIFGEYEQHLTVEKHVIHRLCDLDESPWKDFRNGKPITPRKIKDLLKPFDIQSSKLTAGADMDRMAYHRSSFVDAWKRYLAIDASAGAFNPPVPPVGVETQGSATTSAPEDHSDPSIAQYIPPVKINHKDQTDRRNTGGPEEFTGGLADDEGCSDW